MISISVVIPAYNAGRTIAACLASILGQDINRARFEVIVIDDRSVDETAKIVQEFPVNLLLQDVNKGAPAARNRGVAAATGEWVAFTDADCVPSRRWLVSLMDAVEAASDQKEITGVAGRIVGFPSGRPAARFAAMTGHFDMERQLNHPVYPYAYMANVMYRRAAIHAAGGFNEATRIYATPEFHHRVMASHGGHMLYEPRAVVLHRHPETWRDYWRQQSGYGAGYAAFLRRHDDRFTWTLRHELRAWGNVLLCVGRACLPGRGDAALIRCGDALKYLAQRIGFARTYWRQ